MRDRLNFIHDNVRPQSDEAFDPSAEFQWWYFDSQLDNGYRLLTFYTMNAPGIDTCGLNIVLRAPDGTLVKDPQFYPRDAFAPHEGTFGGVFAPGSEAHFDPHSNDGLGTYHIAANGKRIQYRLQVQPDVPSWSPLGSSGEAHPLLIAGTKLASGRGNFLKKDRFRYCCFVPRGRLSGSLVVDGREMKVNGTVYHEHGMYTFPMGDLSQAWYWLHVSNDEWSIISGSLVAPGLPYSTKVLKKNTHGGYVYALENGRQLMATMDFTGLLVDWKRVYKRVPDARGELSMAWGVEATFRRPGLEIHVDMVAKDVLEYFPVGARAREEPFWGQTVGTAQVEVVERKGLKRTRRSFSADAVLETMRNNH